MFDVPIFLVVEPLLLVSLLICSKASWLISLTFWWLPGIIPSSQLVFDAVDSLNFVDFSFCLCVVNQTVSKFQ